MRRVGALALAALLASPACAEIGSQTDSYATLDEARGAGAIADGRMPDVLPSGAYEIRTGFVPNRPARWGLFNFRPADAAALQEKLGQEIGLDGLVVDVPARIEWWPVALRRTLDGEQLRLTGLRGYRSRDGRVVVAVNWNQGRAYYWTPGG